MPASLDDLKRFYDELHAARTLAEATEVFENADWIFVDMRREKRVAEYRLIQDIINGKRA
jgi:hypothetical protein